MPRTGRKHSATGIYHVMLRGVNRQGVFEESEDYREGWNQKPLTFVSDYRDCSIFMR